MTQKRITAIFLLFIMAMSMTSCSINKEEVINEVNDNSNLPFPLLLPNSDLDYDESEYQELPMMGGSGFENDSFRIILTGWPDNRGSSDYITEISFTDPAYSIFGVKVGDDYLVATEVLEKHGYKEESSRVDSGNDYSSFMKNDAVEITISFNDNGTITKIYLNAILNEPQVVF